MKKLLFFLCMVCVTFSTFGQGIDVNNLDLSKAEMSLAGPDRIYVTNIYYDNTRLSVLLKSDGAYGATIYGPWYDDDKLLYDSYELGYAALEIKDGNTVQISDLLLGGKGYAGALTYDGATKLIFSKAWLSDTPKTFEQQIATLQERLILGQKRYEEQLSILANQYETRIEFAEDSADAEVETALAAAAAKAKEELTAAVAAAITAERRKFAAASTSAAKSTAVSAQAIDLDDLDLSKARDVACRTGPHLRNQYLLLRNKIICLAQVQRFRRGYDLRTLVRR